MVNFQRLMYFIIELSFKTLKLHCLSKVMT